MGGLNVGEVFVELGLKDGKFRAGLKSNEGHAKAFGNTLKGALATGAAMAASTIGFNGIAEVMKSTVGAGLDINSVLEQNQVAFQVLTRDADKASGIIKNLYQYAATTPFEFPDIANAARTLQTVGLEGDKVIKWVGDLAAANPQATIGEVASAIARLKSGSFGEAFERLREFGISRPMLEGAGLKFDKQGSYKGSVNDAMKAVKKIVADKYGGMADAQSKTFSGMVSTIKDTVNMTLGTVFKPMFDNLKAVMPKIIEKFGAFSEAFKKGGMSKALETILPKDLVKNLSSIVNTGKRLVGELFKSFKSGADTKGIDPMGMLKTGVKWAAANLPKLKPIMGSVGKILAAAFNGAKEAISTIGTVIANNKDKFTAVFNGIQGFLKWVSDNGPMVKMLVKDIVLAFVAFKTISAILKGVQLAMAAVNFVMAMNPIGLVVMAIVAAAALIIIYWKPIKAFFKGLWAGIKTAATSAWASITGALKGAWAAIKGAAGSAFHGVVSAVSSAWSKVKSSVGSAWGAIKGAVTRAWNSIVNGLKSAVSGVASIGSNIVTGLWNGAKGMVDWVVEKVRGLGTSILTALKAVLGIKSPSTKAYAVGKFFVQGFANAVKDHGKLAAKSAKEMGKAAFKSLSDAVSGYRAKLTELRQSWTDALTAKKSEIMGGFSTFDAPQITQTNKTFLADNLAAQVAQMKTWAAQMKTLAQRGVQGGLMAELQAAGPQAAGQVAALSSMTQAELKAYLALYAQKAKIADAEARRELAPLKASLNAQANAATEAFKATIKKLKVNGHNAMKAFAEGIHEGMGAVSARLRQVAEQIRRLLGFQSPTEEGPGSKAHKWAPAFMAMYATGIKKGVPRLAAEAMKAANALNFSPSLGGIGLAGMPNSVATGGTVINRNTIKIEVNGSQDPRSAAQEIYRELHRMGVV